jgi:hypothetical protein
MTNIHWAATQRVMVAKLTRLTHKIVIPLHLVAESCIICSSCSRQPVWKLLDTPLYYLWIRKSLKWTNKFVRHAIMTCLFNGFFIKSRILE